jgi:YgiT-type zinc finger domain-containing protein
MVKGRKTNLPYELSDERVIIVRNVPAIICFQCGDAFIEADILSKVEKILQALGSGLQYCNSGNCFQ